MKAFLLAAAVAAGLVCSASTADAQFRYRSGPSVYIAPSYNSFPSYGYVAPSYYSGGVVTSSYVAPSYYGGVVTSSYVAPSYYAAPSYYDSYVAPVYPSVGYSSYYGGSYYGYRGGYRGWRW